MSSDTKIQTAVGTGAAMAQDEASPAVPSVRAEGPAVDAPIESHAAADEPAAAATATAPADEPAAPATATAPADEPAAAATATAPADEPAAPATATAPADEPAAAPTATDDSLVAGKGEDAAQQHVPDAPLSTTSAALLPPPRQAILIPDGENDCSIGATFDTVDDLWYHDAAEVVRDHGIRMRIPVFPDGRAASAAVWVPFVTGPLGLDADTLVVAHGTGAACLLHILSLGSVSCGGAVLVAPYDTDLGDPREMASGYFALPFDYDTIKKHCPWFVVIYSDDDPFVPAESSLRVAAALDAVAQYGFQSSAHFVTRDNPELLEALRQTLSTRYGEGRGRPAVEAEEAVPVHAPPSPSRASAVDGEVAAVGSKGCMPASCVVA